MSLSCDTKKNHFINKRKKVHLTGKSLLNQKTAKNASSQK